MTNKAAPGGDSTIDPVRAQLLLLKCTGVEIWDAETCRQEGVPEAWIQELSDGHESGFRHDRQTIYVNRQVVNQYEGVQDLQLAYKLAEYLGIDWQRATSHVLDRAAIVAALQAELDEL